MKILTWFQFQNAVAVIARHYEGRAFNGIYGVPRGGLPLAVTLSHYLKLPLLDAPEDDILIVDDIYETGRTLKEFKSFDGCAYTVWITKDVPTFYFAADAATKNEWVVFPWEDPCQAQIDMEDYYASH